MKAIGSRLATLATIQTIGAIIVAPSGLLLEVPVYASVWASWLTAGIIALATKDKPHTVVSHAVAMTIVCFVAIVALPLLAAS